MNSGIRTVIKKRVTLAAVAAAAVGVLANASSEAGWRDKKETTFARDVAPILYKHCAECHRPNEAAPFSVLTFNDVRPWARSIREQVVTREMPPWPADPRYGDFINDARLSQQEIKTIVAWVDQGARQGDPGNLPAPPFHASGWRIGRPDMVFAMSEEYVIEPNAPDSYVYAVIPTKFKEDKWIQAAELTPGNNRVVHHAIAHVLTPRAIAKSQGVGEAAETDPTIFYKEGGLSRVRMDAPVIDDGANDPGGGAAFRRRTGEEGTDLFSILLASYAPGKGPDVYPPGMAKRVPAGSLIVLQIHYSSFRQELEQPEKDMTRVAVVFAKEPPEKRVMTLTVQNHFFKIPPGAPSHEVTAAYTFDVDVDLIGYMPHMHLRGKDMKYEMVHPDGKRETLLWVPGFNFNWQIMYRLKSPLSVPKGARIIVTAHFDNSPKNKYNPDPTRWVRWGDPTYDEMMIGWMEYAVPKQPPPVEKKP